MGHSRQTEDPTCIVDPRLSGIRLANLQRYAEHTSDSREHIFADERLNGPDSHTWEHRIFQARQHTLACYPETLAVQFATDRKPPDDRVGEESYSACATRRARIVSGVPVAGQEASTHGI